MKAVIIRTNGQAMVKDITPTLDSYYEIIGCECIDIVTRDIGGKIFDIVCDDDGLFRDDATITAVDSSYHAMLVGNLIICHHDAEGHLTGLDEDDVRHIGMHLMTAIDDNPVVVRHVLKLEY